MTRKFAIIDLATCIAIILGIAVILLAPSLATPTAMSTATPTPTGTATPFPQCANADLFVSIQANKNDDGLTINKPMTWNNYYKLSSGRRRGKFVCDVSKIPYVVNHHV